MRELSSDSEIKAEEPPQKRKQRRILGSDSELEHSEADLAARDGDTPTSGSDPIAAHSEFPTAARRAVLEGYSYAAFGASASNAFTVLQDAAAAATANVAPANKFIDRKKKLRCFFIIINFTLPLGFLFNYQLK